ncbi:hypothetical protein MTO96_032504 [Rhipicephalus appendiculatus]
MSTFLEMGKKRLAVQQNLFYQSDSERNVRTWKSQPLLPDQPPSAQALQLLSPPPQPPFRLGHCCHHNQHHHHWRRYLSHSQ